MACFSTLRTGELLEVVRYFSRCPRSEKWRSFLPDDSLKQLIDADGPFARRLITQFKTLHVVRFSAATGQLYIPNGPSFFLVYSGCSELL